KKQIEDEEAREASQAQAAPAAATNQLAHAEVPRKPAIAPTAAHFNPVLQAQLENLDAEIAKHKAEQQRLTSLVATYRTKLDAIPLREQEIASLDRDYQMSKKHYSDLLEKQLSAQTASQ